MKIKNQNGVTLIALIITIILIIILASITINFGTETIEKAKLENVKTNMLLLQGKLKAYAEDVKFSNPNKTSEELEKIEITIGTKIIEGSTIARKAKNAGIDDITGWYYFTGMQLEEMGLKDIQKEEGEFIVKFDIENATVKDTEIVYTPGYNESYTLKDINNL